MTDRGEWRGIRSVLIDGKDYQALRPNARLVLLTLKLTCGQAGICVMPAWPEVLAERTGIPAVHVIEAARELEAAGWIRIERSIIWIIDGLKHEPGYFPNNSFHQRGLLKFLGSLPRLQIVEDFRAHYAYLPGLSPTGTSLTPEGGSTPSPEPVVQTQPDTPAGKSAEEPGAGPPPAKSRSKPAVETWVQEGAAWWEETVGSVGYARFGKALKPFVDRYGWERVKLALVAYTVDMQESGKTLRVEWFAAEAHTRIERKIAKPHTPGMKPWEQAEYDQGLAKLPQVTDAIKAYKKQLNGEGDAWWMQMKQEAKSKNRHPIAYAHEWIEEAFRGD